MQTEAFFNFSVLMTTSHDSSLTINELYTSRAFQRVQEHPIRCCNERDMAPGSEQ